MKKRLYLFIILSLIAIDQGAKLLVFHFLQNKKFFIIGDFLKLKIVVDHSTTSAFSLMGIVFPPFVNVGIKIGILLFILWFCFYCRKKFGTNTAWHIASITIVSGTICSVMDSAIWRGTLDFIDIASSFAYDLKDIYLDIGCISLVVYAVSRRIWTFPKKN